MNKVTSTDISKHNEIIDPSTKIFKQREMDKAGIKCYINGNLQLARMKLKEQSSQNFQTLVSSKDIQKISPGVYPFTISANCEDYIC